MTTPPVGAVAVASKVCKGACRKLLPATEFYANGKGGLRSECRRCSSHAAYDRQREHRKQSGVRQCDTCHKEKPLGPDGAFAYDGKRHRYVATCAPCVEWLRDTLDPLVEAEDDLQKGLRARQRWATTLVAMLTRWGISLEGYKALRGEVHARFEAEWSEAMKLACRAHVDAGKTMDELYEEAEKCRPRTLTPAASATRDPQPSEVETYPWPVRKAA